MFKACICYFHQIFSFWPNDSPSKTEKCLLFHLKSSFRPGDIQIFVFLFFPLFLPLGHCFGEWSKINLQVHDIINWLHKNSITHFVWYLEKNHAKNVQQKLVPHLFIILVNNPKQPLHRINYLKSKILWKRIIKKPWKGNFNFSFEPSPFQKTKISKTKGAWN